MMNHMNPELYRAVVSGDIDELKKLEGLHNVKSQLTPSKLTVLHLASQSGSVSCVKEILRLYPDLLFYLNSAGETALHLAASQGHCQVVEALVFAAGKLSWVQPGISQLYSFPDPIKFIRTANVESDTALHEAVRYNHLDVVKVLLKEDPGNSHTENKRNETPLYLASIRGYTDIITAIFEICTVSPAFGGPEGRSALHAAVLNDGRSECVKLLLAKDPDLIKKVDSYGWTAFHYVAYYNLHTIIGDLLSADKSVAYVTDKINKRTAVHVAVYEGNILVTMELLKHCPDSCEIVDGKGRNILHIAVEQGQKEMIEFILQNCPSTNSLVTQKDIDGNTPLHLLAMSGCFVPQLIDHERVDREALNNKNLTPLDSLHYTEDTIADQVKVKKALINDKKVNQHWNLWNRLKDSDVEAQKKVVKHNRKTNDEEVEEYRQMNNTHMIVAALITTVAFTAGFTMPGGLDGNEGENQGSAVLLRRTAFKAFMITDTIAMLLSTSSLFIYFVAAMYRDARRVGLFTIASVVLNCVSTLAMMLAFATGTYAVLTHSIALAVAVCVISSFFFLLFGILLTNIFCGSRS